MKTGRPPSGTIRLHHFPQVFAYEISAGHPPVSVVEKSRREADVKGSRGLSYRLVLPISKAFCYMDSTLQI